MQSKRPGPKPSKDTKDKQIEQHLKRACNSVKKVWPAERPVLQVSELVVERSDR